MIKIILFSLLFVSSVCGQNVSNNFTILKTASFEKHQYLFLKEKFTRYQAAKIAAENFGYLAIPDNIEENNFLSSFSGTNSFWLGIQRKEKGSQKLDFIKDNDSQKINWHNWNRLPGYFEPNFDSLNEWCAIMYGNNTPWWNEKKTTFIGKWNDQSENWLLNVIIEIDPNVNMQISNVATRSQILKNEFVLGIKWKVISQKRYIIQKSINLSDWENINSFIAQTNQISFTTSVIKDVFFRVIEQNN